VEAIGYKNEASLSECSRFISRLIHTLGVREIMRQQVEVTNQILDAKPGVTISVIFLESNLVLHTWPEEKFAELQVSSCKTFHSSMVRRAFEEFFNPIEIYETLNERPWTV